MKNSTSKKSEQINRILPVKCTQNEIVQEKKKLNIHNTNLKKKEYKTMRQQKQFYVDKAQVKL